MGHIGWLHDDCPATGLRCQRLKMVDGSYSTDGTYWGAGNPKIGYMYAIFNGKNAEYEPAMGILQFVRAKTRKEAIEQWREEQPFQYEFARDNR